VPPTLRRLHGKKWKGRKEEKENVRVKEGQKTGKMIDLNAYV
jgi:hypothetical protein